MPNYFSRILLLLLVCIYTYRL